MKLEIVKETKITGDVIYFIESDGKYIRNTIDTDLLKVEDMYNRIVKSGGGDGNIKEIIKTTNL
jgi:hypothetical protein